MLFCDVMLLSFISYPFVLGELFSVTVCSSVGILGGYRNSELGLNGEDLTALTGKNLFPRGANCFLLEQTTYRKGAKQYL